MEQLRNDKLTIEMSDNGAELHSIKDNQGIEYLWQAAPEYWARHSPILFPIVGKVWEDRYTAEGKTYQMSQHGFARDMQFKLVNKTNDRVTYALTDNEETLKKYPYHFMLNVTYRLVENTIEVIWQVLNTDTREIHFQVGGHPAFNLFDAKENGKFCGTLKFDTSTPLKRCFCTSKGCRPDEIVEVQTENGYLNFTEETFKDNAMIMTGSQLKEVALIGQNNKALVTLNFRSPAVGLWMPAGKNAPFICIEPWYGVTDQEGYNGEFKDKLLMNHLQPGASFLSKYTITIN